MLHVLVTSVLLKETPSTLLHFHNPNLKIGVFLLRYLEVEKIIEPGWSKPELVDAAVLRVDCLRCNDVLRVGNIKFISTGKWPFCLSRLAENCFAVNSNKLVSVVLDLAEILSSKWQILKNIWITVPNILQHCQVLQQKLDCANVPFRK